MPDRWETHDSAAYRTLLPGQERPCEVRVLVDGVPVWCRGSVSAWQRRAPGEALGPDGWWGYCEWLLPSGHRAGGWAHASELRPRPADPRGPSGGPDARH